jgi:tetratricopeptide (TPR) repeat protein
MMKKIFTVLFFTTFIPQALASNIEIVTNPEEAEVFVINPENGERVTVGTTPYEGPLDLLGQKAGGATSFVIEIDKPGFESYRLLYSIISSSDVTLRVNLPLKSEIKLTQDLDLLMSDLFDVQRMVRGKDYTSALAKIELLEAKFPQYSILHEIKGSVFYLTQDFTRALAAYRRAFSLNAKNRDAYRMKIYLERKFKTDEVASN